MLMSQLSNTKISEIDFSLKSIHVMSNRPEHQFSADLEEHFRVLYVLKGSAKFDFSDKTIIVKPRDILQFQKLVRQLE